MGTTAAYSLTTAGYRITVVGDVSHNNAVTLRANVLPKLDGSAQKTKWGKALIERPQTQFIQIWPVADGGITGIAANQLIRYSLPQLTMTLNDLYPYSTTYAQVYKGNAQLGVTGTVVPGSALVINDSVPASRVLVVNRFRVPAERAESFRVDVETARAALGACAGYAGGEIGRNVDDPALWVPHRA